MKSPLYAIQWLLARIAGVWMVIVLPLIPLSAHAQAVALAGMVGGKPLLVINGSAPKAVGVGDSYMGVKVLSASGDRAVVQSEGMRLNLRVGASPVSLNRAAAASVETDPGGTKIVLTQGQGGHFFGSGAINGRAMRFMVDTGATTVAMSVAEARRLGLKYQEGVPMRASTANGIASGWSIKLNSVRVGNVTVYDVQAAVVNSSMPTILLGNSFLNRFTMTRNGTQMVLERRY